MLVDSGVRLRIPATVVHGREIDNLDEVRGGDCRPYRKRAAVREGGSEGGGRKGTSHCSIREKERGEKRGGWARGAAAARRRRHNRLAII